MDLILFLKCVNPHTLRVLIVYVSRGNVAVKQIMPILTGCA